MTSTSNETDWPVELLVSVTAGLVRRVAQGLYYVPRYTPFGEAPPSEEELVRRFLDDDHFLLFNPSVYNSLGLGTTQLYRRNVVYNHKRHGLFTLAGFEFDFRDILGNKTALVSLQQIVRELENS